MRLILAAAVAVFPVFFAEGKGNRYAAANVEYGERAYQKCTSCHALEPRRNTPAGPTLYRIVGRRIAAERFGYSPALRRFAKSHPVWTPQLLERMAQDPERLIPGTKMDFHGIADAYERRALVDFLQKQAPRKR